MVKFFIAYAINLIVASSAGLAMSFGVLAKTGNPADLGINLASYYLPSLAAPLVGSLVDRVSTRMILLVSNATRAVLLLLFALCLAHSNVSVAVLFGFSCLVGFSKLPQGGAFRKAFSTLIRDDEYSRDNARYAVVTNSSSFIGALIGGAAIATLEAPTTLLWCAFLFALSSLTLLGVPVIGGGVAVPSSDRSAERAGLAAERTPITLRNGRRVLGPTFIVIATVYVLVVFDVITPAYSFSSGYGAFGQSVVLGIITVFSAIAGVVLGVKGSDGATLRFAFVGSLLLVVTSILVVVSVSGGYPVLILVGAACVGVGSTLTETAAFSWFHKVIPLGKQGYAFTLISSIQTLSTAAFSLLLGFLATTWYWTGSAGWWLLVCFALVALGPTVSWFFLKGVFK